MQTETRSRYTFTLHITYTKTRWVSRVTRAQNTNDCIRGHVVPNIDDFSCRNWSGMRDCVLNGRLRQSCVADASAEYSTGPMLDD